MAKDQPQKIRRFLYRGAVRDRPWSHQRQMENVLSDEAVEMWRCWHSSVTFSASLKIAFDCAIRALFITKHTSKLFQPELQVLSVKVQRNVKAFSRPSGCFDNHLLSESCLLWPPTPHGYGCRCIHDLLLDAVGWRRCSRTGMHRRFCVSNVSWTPIIKQQL